MTQRAFAKKRGVALRSFVKWLTRSRERVRNVGVGPTGDIAFVEIPGVISSQSSNASGFLKGVSYHAEFAQGLRLEIPRGFVVEEVVELCRSLRSL